MWIVYFECGGRSKQLKKDDALRLLESRPDAEYALNLDGMFPDRKILPENQNRTGTTCGCKIRFP